jgi:tetratricopeptide (TPR) repeat protein
MEFKEVDSLTYAYYNAGNWKKLVQVGKKGEKAGYDYFYLYFRMGVASYHMGSWNMAERYLQKALKKSAYNQLALEYLYWTYVYLDNVFKANEVYQQLDESVQQTIRLKKYQPVSAIFAEGGVKLSNNTSIAGNVYYVNAGLEHKIGNQVNLDQGYTFLTQLNNNWGSYYQHQYFLGGSGYIKKGWQLDFGAHVSFYNSTLNYPVNFSIYKTGAAPPAGLPRIDSNFVHQDTWLGKYSLTSLNTNIGFTKKIKRFNISGFMNFQYEWEKPDYNIFVKEDIYIYHYIGTTVVFQDTAYREKTDSIRKPVTRWQLTPGISFKYTLPIWQDRITLGAKIFVPFTADTAQFVFSPNISVRLTKWAWLSGNYLAKNSLPIADNRGSTWFNAYDRFTRFTVNLSAIAFKKLIISLTYQHERVYDSLTLNNYQLNSILCGLKFKF